MVTFISKFIVLFLFVSIEAKIFQPTFESVIEDTKWPSTKNRSLFDKIGQISGITALSQHLILIFHRGKHVWHENSFDEQNRFTEKDKGPISDDAIILLNTTDMTIIDSWGKNKFYLPHGISVDFDGNVWITDVALHQVMRFRNGDWNQPDLIFGEAFQPGNDRNHFCKPTDVAVASTGDIFISDGYCNSRIVRASPQGKIIDSFGVYDNMIVPHSLTLLDAASVLCAADRENARIICYNIPSGQPLFQLTHPLLEKIYAIDHIGEKIFALNGPKDSLMSNGKNQALGLTIDATNGQVINQWLFTDDIEFAHDISIAPEHDYLYVTDLSAGQRKLHRFKIN